MKLPSVRDLKLRGKTVFDRVDFNVVEDGKIIDEFRIEAAVPTIEYLLDQGCVIILASHNGKPEGKRVEKLSLEPVAHALSELLDRPVKFMHDCVGDEVTEAASKLKPTQILLLENLRFHAEEEANDAAFARELAALADVYIDDAFGAIHRAHASIVGVPAHLPHAAGLLVEEEYTTLHSLLEHPKKPFTAIIGGAKVADKLAVLENLIDKVDTLVIGGAMANTFLLAEGYHMGKSMVEPKLASDVKSIMAHAKKSGVEVVLPTDLVVAAESTAHAKTEVVAADACPIDQSALDIGPVSAQAIIDIIDQSHTVFWNGTLGMAELAPFARASSRVAKALAQHKSAKSIIGGGDTTAFIDSHAQNRDFDFISTGGGASLDLLAGKKLPGIEALLK